MEEKEDVAHHKALEKDLIKNSIEKRVTKYVCPVYCVKELVSVYLSVTNFDLNYCPFLLQKQSFLIETTILQFSPALKII